MYGNTALDVCMGIDVRANSLSDTVFREKDKKAKKKNFQKDENDKGSENLTMADAIFKFIKDYPFMHSSHFIAEALNEAISVKLPNIGDYIESRLMHIDNIFRTETQS